MTIRLFGLAQKYYKVLRLWQNSFIFYSLNKTYFCCCQKISDIPLNYIYEINNMIYKEIILRDMQQKMNSFNNWKGYDRPE